MKCIRDGCQNERVNQSSSRECRSCSSKRQRIESVGNSCTTRARRENAYIQPDLPRNYVEVLIDFYKCCLKCGTTKALSVDHIKPLRKGGEHSFTNFQILCKSCNSSKRTSEIDYRAGRIIAW